MGAIGEVAAHILPALDRIYECRENREILMPALEHDARELWPLMAVAINRNGYFSWPTPSKEEVKRELDALPNRAARYLRIARAVGPTAWMDQAVDAWLKRASIAHVRDYYTDYYGGRGYTSSVWELRGDGFVATMETGRDCPPAFPRHGGPEPEPRDFVFGEFAKWKFI